MFTSLINASVGSFTLQNTIICIITSLILGLIISITYMYKGRYSKNMAISLVILPVLVQIVIMMVNGNVGAGVAVLGAFSLVRFRSVPGSSKEICYIFFAMAVGIATGMGCIFFAIFATLIISLVLFILSKIKFGENRANLKELKIAIPDDLNYTQVFDDIFNQYLQTVQLDKIKTTNLGSMFELTYIIELKKGINEKEFIDEIRCRNGNLTIKLSRAETQKDEL